MRSKRVIIFGSGYMAEEYLKVLKALECEVFIIGLVEEKAIKLAENYGYRGLGGGVTALDSIDCKNIDWVINAASIDALYEINDVCLHRGLSKILVEKPGALTLTELLNLESKMTDSTSVKIACNRRYYNSVITLKQKVYEDGGVIGCFFDFTDRERDIFNYLGSDKIVKRWGWANSIHVIDLAFFLTGLPTELHTYRWGGWERHPTGTVFVGSGKTEKCLFSYFSSWSGGGRWNVEIATPRGRYKLSPLEQLSFCKKNQFGWENVVLPDEDDSKYKPGLYKMVKDVVINDHTEQLFGLSEQITLCKFVNQIFGYVD